MRNKYIYKINLLLFFTLLSPFIRAQEKDNDLIKDTTYVADEVVVTAGRVPIAAGEVPRSVSLITREDIKSLPSQNLQDVLSYTSGVDLKKRGAEGVQADVSIRGGSFEQTLILIDGIKMSDPQTAHHNLNLPVNLSDVEKIEVLKGQASSIYGANALSGVINIITKKGNIRELSVNASGGAYGYYNGAVTARIPLGKFSNTFSFSKNASDGYRHNTDFSNITGYFNSTLALPAGNAFFTAGYTDKKFGANSFYGDKYPNQWEKTKTYMASTGVNYAFGAFTVSPALYWRSNDDYYLLDYTRPGFYKNEHTTNSYGAELLSAVETSIGRIALSGEISFDDINSTNLGVHNRKKGGISAQYVASPVKDLKIIAGGYSYNYADFGWKFWPGIDIGYQAARNLTLFASAGKSFRIPTYTDLYYSSPAQKGNALLQPEEAVSYETGFNYALKGAAFNGSVFYRQGKNLIDWIKLPTESVWNARNTTAINTSGADLSITLSNELIDEDFFIERIKTGYTYLNTDIDTKGYQSRYILDHLRHQFTAEAVHKLIAGIRMNWALRYAARLNQEAYFITDLRVNYPAGKMDFYIEANNVFNEYYLDISGIPMPGRWMKAGFSFNLSSR